MFLIGSLNFERAKFVNVWILQGSQFNNDTNFANAEMNNVVFEHTSFKRVANFEKVRFDGVNRFTDAEFCGEPKFDDIQFSDQLLFDTVRFCGPASFSVQVGERNQLRFRNCALSKVLFKKSNIRNIVFEDVDWPRARFRRLKIADEPEVKVFEYSRPPTQRKELKEARRLYRELRLNYDNAGDYEVAGRFYVSESQMSYLMQPPLIRWIHPRGLYRWASNYGESMLQAGFVLIAMIVVFAVMYWSVCNVFSEQIVFRDVPKPLKTVDTSPSPPAKNDQVQFVSICLSKSEALWLSLQATKPLADIGLSPKSVTYWLAFSEGLLLPTQLALFLLAVRRRFRRGD